MNYGGGERGFFHW